MSRKNGSINDLAAQAPTESGFAVSVEETDLSVGETDSPTWKQPWQQQLSKQHSSKQRSDENEHDDELEQLLSTQGLLSCSTTTTASFTAIPHEATMSESLVLREFDASERARDLWRLRAHFQSAAQLFEDFATIATDEKTAEDLELLVSNQALCSQHAATAVKQLKQAAGRTSRKRKHRFVCYSFLLLTILVLWIAKAPDSLSRPFAAVLSKANSIS